MVSVNQLKGYKICEEFSDDELKKFADIATEEFYKAGDQIWEKGDPATKLCLLDEGKVLLTLETYMGTHRPPMQVTVDIITKGGAMGWSAAVEPYVYTLGARVIDDSQLIAIDAAQLREILNADKALGFKFMQTIAKVVATRLAHTEIILVGERGLSLLTEM